jgi:large subunit ribosomal protein L15
MKLNEIRDNEGSTKNRMRVGRGIGSGKGKTGGRGVKGQKSRTGVAIKGFEGGQMPLHRRLPKRGFTNIFRKEYAVINLDRLNELEGDSFDFDSLKQLGVVKKLKGGLKILGTGELTRALTITAHNFSGSAKEKIEAAGGKAVIVGESQEA